MPIVAADLVWRLSGGASNTDPNAALGGIMSTVAGGIITTGVDNNLFDDISGDEGNDGDTNYRGIYFKNNHGSLTLTGTKVWISSNTTSTDDTINIALADEGEGDGATTGVMETIVDEDTAPVGPSFSAPANKTAGLSFGDLDAGNVFGLWVQRIVNAGAAAIDANSATIRAEGDSAA